MRIKADVSKKVINKSFKRLISGANMKSGATYQKLLKSGIPDSPTLEYWPVFFIIVKNLNNHEIS